MDRPAQTTPTDLIALVRETAAAVRARETDLLVLATVWADAHPDLEADAENAAALRGAATDVSDVEADHDPDAPDPHVPAVAWDAGAPFAAALGVSTAAGEGGDPRRPGAATPAASRVGAAAGPRGPGVAGPPDRPGRDRASPTTSPPSSTRRSRPVAEKVGPVTLDRLIEEAMMRLYPEEVELARLEALETRHVTLHEESLTQTLTGAGDR